MSMVITRPQQNVFWDNFVETSAVLPTPLHSERQRFLILIVIAPIVHVPGAYSVCIYLNNIGISEMQYNEVGIKWDVQLLRVVVPDRNEISY